MRITVICSDRSHPVFPRLEQWVAGLGSAHDALLVERKSQLIGGDILFLISCHEIIGAVERAKFGACLVIHASDLPEGRGWSPHIWQIVEGRNEITVSLIEASENVDTGNIWTQRLLKLEGHELHDEINAKLFSIELELMSDAVAQLGQMEPVAQDGRQPTWYRRRTLEDSRIDPSRSIAEQFDLLRVADPIRFPAFFDYRGSRYVIRLEKAEQTT